MAVMCNVSLFGYILNIMLFGALTTHKKKIHTYICMYIYYYLNVHLHTYIQMSVYL